MLLAVVVPAVVVPRSALSQATVEVGPVLGLYAPVGAFKQTGPRSTSLPRKPSELGGPAWGGEVWVWLDARFGLALQAVVAASRFGGGFNTPAGFVTTPKDAHVVTVTAQVLHRPLRSILPLFLTAGVGVVRRGGDAYSGSIQLHGLTTPSAAVGLGVDLGLGQHLAATVALTAAAYDLNVHDGLGQRFEHGVQFDLLPHVRLAWRSRLR